MVLLGNFSSQDKGYGVNFPRISQSDEFVSNLVEKENSEIQHNCRVVNNTFDKSVDLRIIIITYNRSQSLLRLMTSLNNVSYDGRSVLLELWVDRLREGSYSAETVARASQFQFRSGRCHIHVHRKHVGICGQWLENASINRNHTSGMPAFSSTEDTGIPQSYPMVNAAQDPRHRFQSSQQKSRSCYACQGNGHIKPKCNWTGVGSPQPQSACQLCYQNGHIAVNCKRLKPADTICHWTHRSRMCKAFKRAEPGTGAHLSGLNSTDTESGNSTSLENDSDFTGQSACSPKHQFMYLSLDVGSLNVTALLDTGSAINIMSKTLFDTLSPSCISQYQECSDPLVLANNQVINVCGTATVKLRMQHSHVSHVVQVYILADTSHPFILGIGYLATNGIVLDFGKGTCFSNVKHSTKIKCKSTITVLPNTECIVTGKLSKDLSLGMQGVTVSHAELLHKGLMVAKSVVTCNRDHLVSLRNLNPGNDTVYLHKGMILATFQLCDNSVDIISLSGLSCSHSLFDVNPDLSDNEKDRLYQCLYKHKDMFITPENPDLGHTHVVEHQIHLKPDATSKHQRPYRLPPDKKRVLRHQLDELLAQGIIAPVSEMDNVPITSPIVLVAKRNKPKSDPANITREQSLSSYRFCCDFRYLNSQTQDFRYTIPDLQDFTESFSEKTPNFITTLDLSSGFFQMSISEQSTKYTAFNTSFPRYDLPFRLAVDTSSHGIGYMLYQVHEDGMSKVTCPKVTNVQVLHQPTTDLVDIYDADTEDNMDFPSKSFQKKKQSRKRLPPIKEKRSNCLPVQPTDLSDQLTDLSDQPIDLPDRPTDILLDQPASLLEQSASLLGQSHSLHTHKSDGLSDQSMTSSQGVDSAGEDLASSQSDLSTELSNINNIQTDAVVDDGVSSAGDENITNSDTQQVIFPTLSLLDMTVDQMQNHQAEDAYLKPFIDFLTTGLLPESQKLARSVLLQQSDFVLVDGLLFHSRIARAKRSKLLPQHQLVVPSSFVQAVLTLFHDSSLAAHGGIQDTLDRMRDHFYFPSMATAVAEYVQSCPACQSRKVTKLHHNNAKVAYPTPSAPFSVWRIDLYGPVPVTSRAHTYIFTAVCMFSKFLFAIPLRNKDAVTVSEALFSMFTTYGVCDCLLSDRGSEFTAGVTAQLCKLLQIPQQFSPSFVHHCMGAVERSHATLAARLTPYMNADCNNWDLYLHTVVFAMNNSVHSGQGYSPFEIVYAQRPRFPLVVSTESTFQNPSKDVEQYLLSKVKLMEEIHSQVRDSVVKYQEKMTSEVNAKRQILQLQSGDYVYITDESSCTAKKLKNHYKGPFVVDTVVSPHMVLLSDPLSHKVIAQSVHIDRLKMAYVRQPKPYNYYQVISRVPDKVYVSVSTQTGESVPHPMQVLYPPPQVEDMESTCITPHTPSSISSRPKRAVQKPLRYRDSDHVDPFSLNLGADVSETTSSKIKRVSHSLYKQNEMVILGNFILQDKGYGGKSLRMGQSDEHVSNSIGMENSVKEHYCREVNQTFDQSVDLRIIIITHNRSQSLLRLMTSLNDVNYNGRSVLLEVWVDRSREGSHSAETVARASQFQFRSGRCHIHVHRKHVGIRGQWLEYKMYACNVIILKGSKIHADLYIYMGKL
ncbi:POL4-like protein [Mya arenaria]|uniref:POL4-like protein n=1 Tax=Mya arenaria TaxID=6604 RepID=A0ABY7DSX5_MYAAR|nr:POL4-like protein [Mya arenaria]